MDKQEIINNFAELYKSQGYSPVQGRLVGLFLVSEEKYFTFQELQDQLEVSKSAMSKSIKPLIDYGIIRCETRKDNSRKRYFYLCPDGCVESLGRWLESLNIRRNLLNETIKIREDSNKELNVFIESQVSFLDDAIPYIEENLNNIKTETK